MSNQKSNRILGIVYFNPDDRRLILPMRTRLGWTINFAHPRAVPGLAWMCLAAVIGFILAPIIAHPAWFARHPSDLVWLLAAYVVALFLVHLTQWFTWSDHRLLPLAAFGVLAAGVGFAIQGLTVAPLLLWPGSKLTWQHHAVLGPLAALAQTAGKCFALLLLAKAKTSLQRPDSSVERTNQELGNSYPGSQHLRYGLLVGLGFTIWEITLIYFRMAWGQRVLDYLSLWERASSSMFHIYSAALLTVALAEKRYWLIVPVVVLHALTDFLAGSGESMSLSLYQLESIFSGAAACMWIILLVAGRTRKSDSHRLREA